MFEETLTYIRNQGVNDVIDYGLVLGSGLGDLAQEIQNPIAIPYENIPDFPLSTVEGHKGELVYGQLSGHNVLVLSGRFHYYEGYDLETVTYPIRVFHELGIKKLILTNAAGGVNTNFQPGDLMIISDHLNLSGNNPLIGTNVEQHGPRFVDMTQTYSLDAMNLLEEIGNSLGINMHRGVYTWMSGPTYETPAEINMVRLLGGDAVGMSTVPEAIVARHCGLEVIGISCITNLAAGMQDSLNHEEVVEVSTAVKPKFKELLRLFIQQY